MKIKQLQLLIQKVKFNKHPLSLKSKLRGKVSLKELDKILKEIIKQAEGQLTNWLSIGQI